MRKLTITIQLDPYMYEIVKEQAEINCLSVSAQIRYMLASQIKEHNKCLDTSTKDKIN